MDLGWVTMIDVNYCQSDGRGGRKSSSSKGEKGDQHLREHLNRMRMIARVQAGSIRCFSIDILVIEARNLDE
jgi:hypothetical protein